MAGLYLVGTPIGNLQDMTLRAIQTLKDVDLIAAEDTRHTGKLLQQFQIDRPLISYHHHNRHERLGELLSRLEGEPRSPSSAMPECREFPTPVPNSSRLCRGGNPRHPDSGSECLRDSGECGGDRGRSLLF